jgi:hypothetical protein
MAEEEKKMVGNGAGRFLKPPFFGIQLRPCSLVQETYTLKLIRSGDKVL